MKKAITFFTLALLCHTGFSQKWGVVGATGTFPISRPTVFVLGDTVYMGNGDVASSSYSKVFHGYTQHDSTWVNEPTFIGVGGDWGFHFVINDTAYVGDGATNLGYQNNLYSYSPKKGWISRGTVSGGQRAFSAGFSINGKGYFGTGLNGGTYYNDFYEYDPLAGYPNGTWTAKASFPGAARLGTIGFSINGYGYMGLGATASNAYTDMYQYDPVANTWKTMASMPEVTGRGMMEPGYFVICNKLYVTCGDSIRSGTATSPQLWMFDPSVGSTGTWTRLANFPGSLNRYAPGGFAIGDTGFIYGGEGGGVYKQDMFRYIPSTANMALSGTTASPADTTVCAGITFNLRATGATNYNWSTGVTTTDASITPTSTKKYSVVMNTGSCYAFDTSTVTVISNFTVSISPVNPVICQGSAVTLTALGATTYSWTGTGNNTNTITGTPTKDTTYNLSISNGTCNGDTAISVTVNSTPTISITGNTIVCSGNTTTLTSAGAKTYAWNIGSNDSVLMVTPPANLTKYVVTGTTNGCSSKDSVLITVNTTPTITTTPANPEICAGGQTSLTAAGAGIGGGYTWEPVTGLATPSGTTTNSNPTQTITYTVIGLATNGCKDSTLATVTVNPNPTVTVSPSVTVCSGSTTSLSASGGSNYTWAPATGLSSATIDNPVASPVNNTVYTVTVSNGLCTAKDSTTVKVNSLPTGNAVGTNTILLGANTSLDINNPSAGNTYTWSPANTLSCNTCADPVATPTISTWYNVTINNAAGCSISDSVLVTVKELCGAVYLPNAFSPNGDGHNDVLKVMGNCIQGLELTIYDRWGNVVYQSTDLNGEWDGTCKGKSLNTGTYIYTLNVTDMDNTIINRKGNVTLLR